MNLMCIPYHSPKTRVRAIVWAYGRGQTDTQTHRIRIADSTNLDSLVASDTSLQSNG